VQTSKAPSYDGKDCALACCAILAKHIIITGAKSGERDPRWLADSAQPPTVEKLAVTRSARGRALLNASVLMSASGGFADIAKPS
jgi:hypothetical protein